MDTPELKKWAKKHPPVISIFAAYAVSSIKAFSKYLPLSKHKTILINPDLIPNVKSWLALYKKSRQIRDVIIDCLKQVEDFAEMLGYSWEYILRHPNWYEEGKKELQSLPDHEFIKILKHSKMIISEIQDEIFSDLDTDPEEPIEEDIADLFSLPEVQFAFSVIIPCYIFYGDHPGKYFKKAQKGDMDSIEKILRIDPSALGDPRIFEHFHFASKQKNRSDFNTIISALRNPPKGKTDLQKIKYKVAGLISGLAELIKYKLPSPEIEKLFEALSVDFNQPDLKLVETDDIYEDSIARNIRREKEFWHKYLKLDKK